MSNELTRQLVHIILFTPAFLLPVVSRWQLGLILFGLLILSLTLVPYSGWKKYLFRDQNKKYSRGAIAYFGILIILTLLFPFRAAAAGWAALSLGDGFATLFGSHLGKTKLPWNKKRTYVGSLSFFISTFIGAIIILLWLDPIKPILLEAAVAAAAGALVESLPLKIYDNLTVPLIVAGLLSLI